MMLSSTAWGKFCDRFGRRKGLLSAALLTFAMGVLSAAAPNFHLFLVLRGLTGVGIGGIPQAVTLFAEFLPLAQRAKCVVFIESFWAIGASFEAILAFFVMSAGWGWRWLLLLSSLPLALFSISCLWLPESARYLVAAGRPDLAISSLQRIAQLNERSLPPGRYWLTTFIFISRAFISGAFQCVYVYTPEVYPTTLRALGLGASSSMARLGAIVTPFIAQVASGDSLLIPIM
uniref:Major facilitator superfamily (MFS) profile domain-containing protein n=1 Tax=Meloidogyne javanica TaxID=6303 RepID=A0A915M750_MELJA